jgi:O-acetyl-ADP-ribose deacetylase (regulator of RNase III)
MKRIQILKGDISEVKADAIVHFLNFTNDNKVKFNSGLLRKGGAMILKQLNEIINPSKPLYPSEVLLTTAGNLPSNYIIHTMCPNWQNGMQQEEMKLADSYRNSLHLAIKQGLKTIIFPTNIKQPLGFPKKLVAKIAISTILYCLQQHGKINQVFLITDEDEYFDFLKTELKNATRPQPFIP